jgi:acetyl-CoA acetyltransferase family protein
MKFTKACIPLGGAWCSPFARWQGSLAEVSSLDLAVSVTGRALRDREVPIAEVSELVLGWTIPQPGIFYGAPTVAARLGGTSITGPMISQACATAAVAVAHAATATEAGAEGVCLVVLTDRTSNGPLLAYPSPSSPGGAPTAENWVLDNFRRDPWAGRAMVDTAEAVAAEERISREEIDDVTALRYEQYARALADDRAFQRRYMVPVDLPAKRGESKVVDSDLGVHQTSRAALASLEPVTRGGVVTYGSQTHPADGAAGVIVTTEGRARSLGAEGVARLLGFGTARVEKARMPKAPLPAARAALAEAGLDFPAVDAVVTHNPFAVNDVYFSRHSGVSVEAMNVFGSSLVYGHPQAPTGARGIAELIETLRLRGGGVGLFSGCAAGDTAAAIVLRVDG